MLSDAIIKIENQRKDFKKDSKEYAIAGVLIMLCKEMPALATAVAASGKTVEDCVKAMETYARKHQSGGCGVIDTESGIKIFCDFYGVAGNTAAASATSIASPAPAPKSSSAVNILDFLD